LFTCRFHYPRNPYDVLYTLFPLPAQSIPQNDHYPQFHYTRIKSPRYYIVDWYL